MANKKVMMMNVGEGLRHLKHPILIGYRIIKCETIFFMALHHFIW